ncbi:MAG: Holliday junction resolvase RuvX [Dehalococcoidia bacterium]|nr:Holliday junction resolvase RuvX [Dehalococcoidia bacterium]
MAETGGKRIMGLDVGSKRIGIALSDPTGVLALPLKTIAGVESEDSASILLEIIQREEVGLIVIGLPRSLSGGIGPQALKVMEFVEKIKSMAGLPVKLQDERYSTVAVENMMRQTGTKKKKRDERRDAEAAAYILQNYMESRRAFGDENNG